MDREILVTAQVRVLVMDDREDPEDTARNLVCDVLTQHWRPEHDWGGAFAIIPERTGAIAVTARPA